MTLGCKVNQFETETMEGLFKQRGYEIVPFAEPADVYVVNTCSVTSLSDRKSRQMIRRAHRMNRDAVIAVTGCYAQVAHEEVRAIEGVRLVLGTKERARIVDYVEQLRQEPVLMDRVSNIMDAEAFEDIPLFGTPQRTRAFLKIEEGCENFCSYCIIPYARGPVRSRPLDSVRREAEKLAAAGFHEIVLTGIHLGAYGKDFETRRQRETQRADMTGVAAGENEVPTLADAAREVLGIPQIKRLRLGSLESLELSEELLRLMQEEQRFCKHLHLPLQAGSDAVLKAMNRHYDTEEFARLIREVEAAVPGVAISTDIIVGFPGETEELFEEGLRFAEQMNFARMHVFPYSRRDGTPAARRKDQVPEPVKKERAHRMQMLADRKAEEFHRAFLGRKTQVLFETNTDGITDGLTGNYIRVYTDSPVRTGELYTVRLERIHADGMWGTVVSDMK